MEAMMIKNQIEKWATELLEEYDYPCDSVRVVIDKAWDAKADLRAILSKHPNWDERQQAVVFAANFDTMVDPAHVADFCNWVRNQLYELIRKNPDGVIKGYDDMGWCERDDAINAVRRAHEDAYMLGDGKWGERKRIARYDRICELFQDANFSECVVTQELADVVREKLGDESLVPVVGQKTSRAVNKICKALGLTEIKDMRTIIRNGEPVQKDYGWNYYFAMFGDAINPIHISRYTVISINPLDYWTMSFGTDWASCHTIDKENRRDMDQGHSGMYSSGTESYMLDGTTIIMYTVSPGYNGDMWRADKERRMNFHIASDGKAMVFGRLYPDGRDGGETGLAAQFRKTLQKVLSECTETNNLWKTKKGGKSVTGEFVDSMGTNYDDYFYYSDTGISHLTEIQMPKIRIGAKPICPGCGTRHDVEDNICCPSCAVYGNKEKCGWCGSWFDSEDDGYYCEDNDTWYCCASCAEEAGLVWCENDDVYHEEGKCLQDSYSELWYHIGWRSNYGVRCDDEHWYRYEENAEKDGWVKYDGYWYWEDDMVTNDLTGELIPEELSFSPDDAREFHYVDEDEAKQDGWTETENGWEKVA